MCAVGSYALFLLCRFQITDELKSINFNDNRSWFNIKVNTSGKSENQENEKVMKDDTFKAKLEKMFTHCKVNSSHYLHFGRMMAPYVMEVQEVSRMDKSEAGNWSPDVFDRVYSGGLNFASMRVLADFPYEKGGHVNPRTCFYGTNSKNTPLANQLFPWVENANRPYQ